MPMSEAISYISHTPRYYNSRCKGHTADLTTFMAECQASHHSHHSRSVEVWAWGSSCWAAGAWFSSALTTHLPSMKGPKPTNYLIKL